MISLEDFEKKCPLRFNNSDYKAVIKKLKVLPRTGWLQWDIKTPETVYEHIRAVRLMTVSYQQVLGLSDDELQELLAMIEIHDWPEALVGDGVILGDETDVENSRAHQSGSRVRSHEDNL